MNAVSIVLMKSDLRLTICVLTATKRACPVFVRSCFFPLILMSCTAPSICDPQAITLDLSDVMVSKKPSSKIDATVESCFCWAGFWRAKLICFSALAYRPIAWGISPLPFALGLFASDAIATAENATLKWDSLFSVLMRGTRKSNHPLDVASCGVCTKLCKKKHDACCSMGTVKVLVTNEIDDSESVGDIRVSAPLAFMFSCGMLENPICSFWNIVVLVLLPGTTNFRALLSVACVSFRKTRSKSSLYPGH
jgi:hypothetical protein